MAESTKIRSVIVTIILIIAPLVASFFLGYELKDCYQEEIIKKDTVYLIKYRDVVKFDTVRTTKTYIRKFKYIENDTVREVDTIYRTPAFTDIADTIANQDTLRIEYYFPERYFSILLRQRPDSIQYVNTTIIKTIEKRREWWEVPAYVGGGSAVTLIIQGLIGIFK